MSRGTPACSAQNYNLPTSFGSANFRVDYSYTGNQIAPKNTLPPFTEAKAYSLVNGRVGIKLDEQKLDIAISARNLLDKRYVTQIQDLFASGIGVITNQYGAPRQYGIRITRNF